MKFYIVVYIDSKNEGSLVTKGYYESMSEAESNLKEHAMEYVRSDGGERQERIALQNGRSLEDIRSDPNLNNGLYVQTSENGKLIYVYEKSMRTTGYVFSSIYSYINKVGMFAITEIEFNVPERFSCGCNTVRVTKQTKKTDDGHKKIAFMDELVTLIKETPGSTVKPIKRKYKCIYSKRNANKPLEFPEDINKIHQSN
jgi:hypothetical protein